MSDRAGNFSVEDARTIGIDCAERLFKFGDQGDAVLLMKGRGGRIVAREWSHGSHQAEGASSWQVSTSNDQNHAEWKPAPGLDGLSLSDVITYLSMPGEQLRTVTGPSGARVSFKGIRSHDGAEWWHEAGWRQVHVNGVE